MKKRLFFLSLLSLPLGECLANDYYLTVYNGVYTDDRLGDVLLSKPIHKVDSKLAVIAWSKAFKFEEPHHQWELEAQLGKHYQHQSHSELNLLAIYRWQPGVLFRRLKTSFAIGDGLSYASEIPPLEEHSTTNVGASRLLNYILVEMTAAPIQARNWAIVTRVHHRSGVYGLFNDVEGGSNVIGVGVKFTLK